MEGDPCDAQAKQPAAPDYGTWRADLVAAKAGDRAACSRLVRFLLRWGDCHLPRQRYPHAEDRKDILTGWVAHLTREGLAHLEDRGPEGWERELFVILQHWAIDWSRREMRHQGLLSLDADREGGESGDGATPLRNVLRADEESPEAQFLRREDAAAAWALLERLAEPDQKLLLLRYRDRLTTAEIGRRVGKPRGTVARRLHELLGRMRRWIEEAG